MGSDHLINMGNGSSASNKNGALKETLGDHEESINCMALSEDSSMLVTGSEDSTARMWSTKTDETECIGVLRGHSSYINAVAVVDMFVITGSADSTLRKWDMTTCECLFVYEGHTARIQKLLCTGDFIFSSSYDKTVKAWLFDTSELDEGSEDKACIRTFKGHSKGVYPLIFIPAEESLVLQNEEGPVINPGDVLISGSADSTARSWSFDTGGCLKIFKGHSGAVTTMATDALGKILYSAGADALIKSWNISTGQCLKTMEGHSNAIICIQVVNRLMYTGSADSSAKCWVTEFGDCTRQYKGHKHSVICMKFNKAVLFTGCGDGIARAYDAKSATLRRIFQGHEGAINCMVVVEDKLFTGSSDGTMRVWDAKDISDDLNVDEEPPPAPPAAVVDDGLEKELEKLNKDEDAIQETPEDGIIDDENVPGDEEMKDGNDQGDEQHPPEESSEDAIKDETNPEEVLASG